MLSCPKCKEQLIQKDRSYVCCHGHQYDIAKRGYCNLLLGNRKATGDDAQMVHARSNFLQHGYYEPLRNTIISILEKLPITILTDAGCGEGYYTNEIKKKMPHMEIYGFDLSKIAIDQACRMKTGVQYIVASVFNLPLKDASMDAILSVFAPINDKENARILKDNGYFIKVEPGPKHLQQLKEVLYEKVYDNEEKAKEYPDFILVKEEILDYEISINHQEDIQALFQMTPYYWRTPKSAVEHLHTLTNLKTRVQFHIEVYKKV